MIWGYHYFWKHPHSHGNAPFLLMVNTYHQNGCFFCMAHIMLVYWSVRISKKKCCCCSCWWWCCWCLTLYTYYIPCDSTITVLHEFLCTLSVFQTYRPNRSNKIHCLVMSFHEHSFRNHPSERPQFSSFG